MSRTKDTADGRYMVDDAWGHIFSEGRREVERDVRLVWDRGEERIVAMEIRRGHKWQEADRAEVDDVTDSLVNANPWALDPEHEDAMEMTGELPDWAVVEAPSQGL